MLKISRKKICSGGFVYVELAIALPLLILLMYGLANVSIKIFYLGKTQLADYVLEEEVHDVLSRLIYDARAARSVTISTNKSSVEFIYPIVANSNYADAAIAYREDRDDGVDETDKVTTRVYFVKGSLGAKNSKINYKRKSKGNDHPITGDNYFGNTRVTAFEFSQAKDKTSGEKIPNVLHVTFELQNEETTHKIKISTAIYMPGCRSFTGG